MPKLAGGKRSAKGDSKGNPQQGKSDKVDKRGGKLRTYLPEGEGREWDPTSPLTVEGRLSNPDAIDWWVPEDIVVDDPRQKYDPKDFEVRTRNRHNHEGYFLKSRVTPELESEVQAIVNSKKFPYANTDHFVRVAIYESVLIHRKLQPTSDNHVALLEQQAALTKDLRSWQQYEPQLDEQRRIIWDLYHRGHKNLARKAAHRVSKWISKIPSREIREMYEGMFKAEFAVVMVGVPVKVLASDEIVSDA